jgi:CHAT domain-containing protein
MKIGTARQKEGLFTNAIITFREAIQIAKKLPNGYANIFTPDQLSFYADAAIDLSKNLPSDLDKQGLFAEVFDAFQMQKSSAVEKTLLMSSVRMMSSNPQMRDLVEKLQSAERIRDTDKTQLAAETALLDDQRSKLVEDRLIAQIEQKNQEILRYRQELQANHPNYLELTKTKPVLINELQSFLTPNEAIALFLLGTQSSYIQLITRSEIQLAKIEQGDQAIHEDVKSLRKALEIEGGSVKEFDLNKSYTVYQALFGQVEKQFKNIDHLIVVPTGPLASLPFSILVTKPIAGVDYSKAEWLVKQLAITHTPSLKSFFEKRSTVQLQQASKAFLGFGNPVLAKLQESSLGSGTQAVMISKSNAPSPIKPNMKTAAVISKNTLATNLPTPVANQEPQVIAAGKIVCRDGGPIPASILTAMPSLPDTANEIIQVSKSLGGNGLTDIYLGVQANEVNFRNLNLTDYRVIYFATHGLLPGELKCQSEPGLVLTPPGQAAKDKSEDGVLDASEISQFKLNANLVVLSACNTAGGGGKFGGDSLTGLVEAFFYAGAQNLLVSHWSVPSTATMQLMTQVFANLGSNFSNGSAVSVQKAQQQMVQTSLTAHPVFWGAFVLIGDGAVEGTGSKKMVSQMQPDNVVRHVASQVTLQQSN